MRRYLVRQEEQGDDGEGQGASMRVAVIRALCFNMSGTSFTDPIVAK